jgi:hypothetical protein
LGGSYVYHKLRQLQYSAGRRQAENYRLAKSAAKPTRRLERIYAAIGNILIMLGQQLLSRTQAAY